MVSRHSTFVWEGLDGSRVLAHMPPANTYNAQAFPEEVMRSADKNKDVGVVPDSVMLVGHGDGGGGASPAMLESMRRMRDLDGVPLVQFSTPTRFFAEVKKKEHELPRWVGELYFELHRGTYTTQANTKKKNRQCESLLRDVEILSSQALVMSILSGQYFKYPVETLDKCWKLVLKNCFHDTLPGSCIAEVYKETDRDYREVLGECTSLKNEALSFIGQHLVACAPKKRAKRNSEVKDKDNFSKNGSNHSKPNLLLFMHGTGFHIPKDRLRAVEIDASVHHALPVGTVVQKVGLHFPRAIEAESSRTRTLVACKPNFGGIGSVLNPHLLRSEEGESFEKAVSVEIVGCNEARRVLLKNNKVRAEFSVSGCLESLVLMSANGVSREALTTSSDSEEASCTGGNVLVLYDDLTQFWCGWDTEVWSYEKCKLIGDAVRCEIIEDGPLRAGVYFEYPLTKSGSKIEQFITLQAESERIDFRTEVDWKESRKILRVLFHTQIRSPHAHYDSQFGHVRRPTTFNHSWEIAKFEVVGHQYCDLSEHNFGVALLNDCKYGYSVRDSTMRLSLLRAAKSPDDMADIGVHTMTYGLLPHWGSFPCKVVLDEAADLNWPPQLIVTDEESHGDSVGHSEWVFKVVSGRADLLDTVVVSAIKRAENSPDRIVLRMYETMGGRGKAMLSCPSGMLIASVKECDMLEDDIKWGSDVVLSQAVSEGGIVSTRIEIPFRPFQIRSLLVHCK